MAEAKSCRFIFANKSEAVILAIDKNSENTAKNGLKTPF